MQQINCLNLCEILPYLQKKNHEILESAKQLAGFSVCERIYVGSSFCGKYFLEQSDATLKDLIEICENENIKITLAIPVFSEGDLESGKKKLAHITHMAKDTIDEFTVNDYGMLSYLNSIKDQFHQAINLGSLFMKDYRDPRYEEYFQIPWKPKVFTDYFKKVLEEYNIKTCEFDMTHRDMNFCEVPARVEIGVHVPFTYQTVGRICEYASIHKDITEKFRPNATCENNCSDNLVRYSVSDGNMEYIRFGRTVYFRHPGFEAKDLERYRLIYFPLDL